VAAATAATAALADAATEHDGLAAHDPTVASDVASNRTTFLTHLAHAASFAGSEGSVAVLTVGVLLMLAGRRRIREAAVLGAGMAGAALLVLGVKQLVDRARPGAALRLGGPDGSPSFPSGHTLMTAAFLGLLVWLVWPHLRTHTARAAVVASAVLGAWAVGASRVYLGYHWMTDVVAAWLVAAAWLGTLLLAVSRRVQPPRSLDPDSGQIAGELEVALAE
jgi:membrane-associated phospholipid phosphatase